jgi:hypothetical protein
MSLKTRTKPATTRGIVDATIEPVPSSLRWAVAFFGLIAVALIVIEGILWASNSTKLDRIHAAQVQRELAETLPSLHGQVSSQLAGLQVRVDELSSRWKGDTGVPLTPRQAPPKLPEPVRALLADPRAKSAAECWDLAWRNLPSAAELAERKAQLDAINLRIRARSFAEDDRNRIRALTADVERWSRLVTDAEECSRLIAELLRLRAVSSPVLTPNGAP